MAALVARAGMLRLGNRVRLTRAEQIEFSRDTGVQRLPETVDEYNAALAATVSYWQAVGEHHQCGEAKLLAALFLQKLIR